MCAGAVAMPLLIGADRELRDMSSQGIAGQLEHDIGAASPSFLPELELEIIDIGDKIALPYPLGVLLAFAAKVFVLAGVAVAEDKVVVENKVRTMVDIDYKGGRSDAEEPGRFIPLAVEVLTESVQRRREKAALAPFKSLFLSTRKPYRGSAPA